MTEEAREELLEKWKFAKLRRETAEGLVRYWLCEEQALAHKLWGHPFPEHPHGT